MDYHEFKKKAEEILEHPVEDDISVSWITGGKSGGSCWGTSNEDYYDVAPEQPKELEELDKILEVFCPRITYLKFKKLTRIIEKKEWQDIPDYYGNYYASAGLSLNLQALYDFLVEEELI